MKTLNTLTLCLLLLSPKAFSAVTLQAIFKWAPDSNQLAGLTVADYMTNITFWVYGSTNVALPLTSWVFVTNWQGAPFLSQGPAGSWWTNSIGSDGNARFYTVLVKNNNGGASPFSNLAPWLTDPLTGFLGPFQKQSP